MSNKSHLGKDRQRSPINLAAYNPELHYTCEEDGYILFPYPDHLAAQQFPTHKGPHLICPNCHIITDLSLNKPPGLDEVNPIDLQPPAFVTSMEEKGDNMLKVQEYDPEPNEDKWLKSIGATLISKRVQV